VREVFPYNSSIAGHPSPQAVVDCWLGLRRLLLLKVRRVQGVLRVEGRRVLEREARVPPVAAQAPEPKHSNARRLPRSGLALFA
jgi:hypothetical protein